MDANATERGRKRGQADEHEAAELRSALGGARRVERRVFRALMVRPTRAAVRPTPDPGCGERHIYQTL